MASEKRKAKMTKQEAIHILMHIETNVEHDEDFGIMVKAPLMDACVLAIRALKADAVEVVRCKDCKYRCNGKDCDHPLLLSWSWGAIRNVKDDDFCSYGERKENEQT